MQLPGMLTTFAALSLVIALQMWGIKNDTSAVQGNLSSTETSTLRYNSSDSTVKEILEVLSSGGAVVAYIATAVGTSVSSITFFYNRKGFRLRALAEAFRLLNEKEHREARKVIYGEHTLSSFNILGLERPTA
jgi:hypothetical protein